MKNKTISSHQGSDFDSFLKKENLLEHSEAVAIKRVIAWQIKEAMKQQHITKIVLAKRMHTSRSAVDRVLDPDNESVTLTTLNKVANVLGKKMLIEIR